MAQNPLRIAVLCGSDARKEIVWDAHLPAAIGNANTWRALELAGLPWRRVHLSPAYFAQPKRWNLARFDAALNIVTDPDRDPATLCVAQRVVEDAAIPVVNTPASMWPITRDGVAARLGGIEGLVVPKTLRLKAVTRDELRRRLVESGFRFPGLLRVAGTQIGETLRPVQRVRDLEPTCDDPSRSYILAEFVDFQSSDRFYRKIRFFFVGERIVIRHRIVSTSWNIHSGSRDGIMTGNAALAAEEDAFITGGPEALPPMLQRALSAVRRSIGLDYFGMDCALLPSGELVLFEANATMSLINYDGALPSSPAQHASCMAIAHALADLIRARAGDPSFAERRSQPAGSGMQLRPLSP